MVSLVLDEYAGKAMIPDKYFLIFSRSRIFDHLKFPEEVYNSLFWKKLKDRRIERSIVRKHFSMLLTFSFEENINDENIDTFREMLKHATESFSGRKEEVLYKQRGLIYHLILDNIFFDAIKKNGEKVKNIIPDVKLIERDIKKARTHRTSLFRRYINFLKDYDFLPSKDELKIIISDLKKFDELHKILDECRESLEKELLEGIYRLRRFFEDFDFLLTDKQKKFLEDLKKRLKK